MNSLSFGRAQISSEPVMNPLPPTCVTHAHIESNSFSEPDGHGVADRVVTNDMPVYGIDSNQAEVVGHVISYEPIPAAHDVCWYCSSRGNESDLYKPCVCSTFIHRQCFRKWRTGWINPKNYFSCPNCMYNYNIERVRPESDLTREKIIQQYRLKVASLWLSTIIAFGIFIAAVAVIAYFADDSDKNIPVGVRYLLSSVAGGWPNSNSTKEWRANFKQPDVYVWPYYTVLGILCASFCVVVLFCAAGCTFNESDRKQRTCDVCSNCCNTSDAYIVYSVSDNAALSHSTRVQSANPQNSSEDGCCRNCSGCQNFNLNTVCCTTCDCSGDLDCDCKLDGDAAILIVIVVVIVVIAVILSAIVIIVLFAIHKWALFYQEVNRMLINQQQEMEGETMVLGVNERWRPSNAV